MRSDVLPGYQVSRPGKPPVQALGKELGGGEKKKATQGGDKPEAAIYCGRALRATIFIHIQSQPSLGRSPLQIRGHEVSAVVGRAGCEIRCFQGAPGSRWSEPGYTWMPETPSLISLVAHWLSQECSKGTYAKNGASFPSTHFYEVC